MEKSDIQTIRKQILKKYNLKIKDKISYDILHKIYLDYNELYDEKTFAQEVLEISYGVYCKIKYNSSTKAIILKDENIDIEKLRMEILQKYSLKPGDRINYKLLQRIVQDYKNIVNERIIAYEILEISKMMLYPIKSNPQYSTTILSSQLDENIEYLKEMILEREGLKPGDKISYDDLKRIAEKYNINENYLATDILGMKRFNFDNIKHQKHRKTTILPELLEDTPKQDILKKKKQNNKELENLENIRNTIIKEQHLIIGEKINYARLYEIYLNSGLKISEKDFAIHILGLNYNRYFNIKTHRNEKAIILKNKIEEKIIKVREKLKEDEGLYPGDTINYDRLQELIENYKNIIEETILVRNVLGLSAEVVRSMKNKTDRQTIIMKDSIEEVSEEEILNIRNELINSGKIKPGQRINFEEFRALYNQYRERLEERTFALKVLQIPKEKYLFSKRKSTKKVIVCKELINELSQEELEIIMQSVYEEYGIREGQKINYQKLLEISNKYKDVLNEKDFAKKILGITERSYWNLKYFSNINAYILNPFIKEKADKIRYLLNRDKRYYTIDEIEKICQEYDITVEQFCHYILERELHKKTYFDSDLYMKILQKKGKVFIGRGERITKEFARKHQKLIIDFSRSLAVELCRKYQAQRHIDDYAQDTMMYIIEHCGDLEKNFDVDFENWCKGLIYVRAKVYLVGRILQNKKIRTKSIETYFNRKGDNEALIVKDEDEEQRRKENIQNDFSDRPELIRQVLEHIKDGFNPNIAIKNIAEAYGIEEDELLDEIKSYYKNQEQER